MKKFKFLGYEFSPVGYLPEDYTGINNYLVEIPVQLPVQYNRMAFRAMCNDIDPLPSVFRCESGDYAGKIIVPGKQSLYIYSGPYKPLEVNTDDKETPDASSATSETPAEPVDSSTETEEAADSPAGTADTAPAEAAEPVKANEEAGATAPAIGATEPPAPTTAEKPAEKPEAQKEPTTAEKPAEKSEAQKRAEEQAKKEKERVAALSPEAAAEEAAKRVKTDTDRLTGHNMRVMVGEHIERKCSDDPEFSRLVLQPGKKMERCFRFIMRKAREYAEAEMKALGEQRMGVYGTDVPDDIVYGWAVEYFTTPVVKEDEEDKPKPPAARPQSRPRTKPAKGKASGKTPADAKNSPEKTTATEKPKQEQTQLSLF